MKLIIGGAYQGKREYAETHFDGAQIITDFHLIVKDWIANGEDPLEMLAINLVDYQDLVIISDDISCGVVPDDPKLRFWRESMGRVLTRISQESDEVIRVFCGIGVRLK